MATDIPVAQSLACPGVVHAPTPACHDQILIPYLAPSEFYFDFYFSVVFFLLNLGVPLNIINNCRIRLKYDSDYNSFRKIVSICSFFKI